MRCSFAFKDAGIATAGPNRLNVRFENEAQNHPQQRSVDGEVETRLGNHGDAMLSAGVTQPHQQREANAEQRPEFPASTAVHRSAAGTMAAMAAQPSLRHDGFADSPPCNPGILKIFHPRVCTLQAALSRMFGNTPIGIAATSPPLVTTMQPGSGEPIREVDAVVKLCRSTFVCMPDTCSDSFRARFGDKQPEAPLWSQVEVGSTLLLENDSAR